MKSSKSCYFFLITFLFFTINIANAGFPVRVGEIATLQHARDDTSFYHWSFDEGFGNWTTCDATASNGKWHIDDFNAYAGNSWWCGDSLLNGYSDEWVQYLISPSMDLSSVVSPVLSFRLYYAVQDTNGVSGQSGGEYDGFDGCNVWISEDNGISWIVLDPVYPVYDCTSLMGFGESGGFGSDIPGWSGESGSWIQAEFDLSSFSGNEAVKFKFGFASDESFSTVQDSTLKGFFVDEISVDDGFINYLTNDADNPPYPAEFTLGTAESAGDWWMINESVYHTAPAAATCDIADHYLLSDALVSPWLYIPVGYYVYYTFWLWCDMPDYDGDGLGSLEDYYHVEGSFDGLIWSRELFGFYDFGAPGRPGANAWEEYLPGDPYVGNLDLDLTPFAGQYIKLRWRVETDGNDDGGIGAGLHIDDFNIWLSIGYNMDVGAEKMEIPFPTSISNGNTEIEVTLTNYGNYNLTPPAFAMLDSTKLYALGPWTNIPAGESIIKTFSIGLDTLTTGTHFLNAYTAYAYDENKMNDTTFGGYFDITPESVYELGYDGRQITVPNTPYYYWQFAEGEGAACRFDPADHIIPEGIDIKEIKLMFYSEGECTIHIYDNGEILEPGEQIYSTEVNVVNTVPDWTIIDVSAIPQLDNRIEPFWVWVESHGYDNAQITGDDNRFGEGHYYVIDGSNTVLMEDYEFYIRVMADGNGIVSAPYPVETQPAEFILYPPHPNPFNQRVAISYQLQVACYMDLSVFDIQGREVAQLLNGYQNAGYHEIIFDAKYLVSGVYFVRLEARDFNQVQKMVLMK